MQGRRDERTDRRLQFGQRVREIREVRQFSQEELAFRAGLHQTYLSDIERGKRNVSLLNIWKLAEALEIEPAELFRSHQ